jgi:hypothetical protein
LAQVAAALAGAGHSVPACEVADEAVKVAEAISDKTGKAEVLAQAAAALATAGDRLRAQEVATQARELGEAETFYLSRAEVLIQVAAAFAAIDDTRDAANLIGAAWLALGDPLAGWACMLSFDPDACLKLAQYLCVEMGTDAASSSA